MLDVREALSNYSSIVSGRFTGFLSAARKRTREWQASLSAWRSYNSLIYNPRYLTKGTTFIAVFVLLAPVIGFVLPNTELYDLANRVLVSGSLDLTIGYAVLAVLLLLNLLVMRTFLRTKYVMKNQGNMSTFFIFSLTFVLAIIGFWTRVTLAYKTPDAMDILEISPRTPRLDLPPSKLAAGVAVAVSLPLFSAVYGLAAGSYSKVNYASFQSWTDSFFRQLDELEERFNRSPPGHIKSSDLEDLAKALGGAVDALEENIPLEPGPYAEFVKSHLNEPLSKILKRLSDGDFLDTPEVVLDMRTEEVDDGVGWSDRTGLRTEYLGLSKVLR